MTIAQVITNGYISSYLAALYNQKQELFSPALAAPTSPKTILMVTDALNWGYTGGAQTTTSLVGVSKYLIWLCGKFGLEAQFLTATGGSVTPIPPTGFVNPLIFVVAASGTPLIDGQSALIISQFINFNLQFTRNGIVQSTVITESSYYTWDKTTGAFFCSPAASTGELFILMPV